MSFSFKHTWNVNPAVERAKNAQRDGLTATAAQGEAILKSPAPTGWPRRTGFLAASSGHEPAEEDGDGFVSRVTVQAEYWIYVNNRTKTMERMGEQLNQILADEIESRM